MERIGSAAALVLGEEFGTLVRNVLEGIKRKAIPASAGRLVLERVCRLGCPFVSIFRPFIPSLT